MIAFSLEELFEKTETSTFASTESYIHTQWERETARREIYANVTEHTHLKGNGPEWAPRGNHSTKFNPEKCISFHLNSPLLWIHQGFGAATLLRESWGGSLFLGKKSKQDVEPEISTNKWYYMQRKTLFNSLQCLIFRCFTGLSSWKYASMWIFKGLKGPNLDKWYDKI